MAHTFAVELENVSKQFGSVTAVDQISLQIREGEFFSLLGPSGCGKTTTLRMIAGFELPSSGEIYIGGDPQGYLPAYRRPVNTVFQHYALFPHLTVYQNIAFGLEMQKVPKDEIHKRVMLSLEMVHLPRMEKRYPKQLSGGQQQRVALARALVNQPKVLLLDEPLGALDLKLRKAMQVELKNLQHQVGITFIYVTHDQEEALTMSDRIAVMHGGKVLQVGSPQQIYEAPRRLFVADFIGETNLLPGKLNQPQAPAQILLAGGTLAEVGWTQEGLNPGEAVSLSIRPEKISLHPLNAPALPQTTALPAIVQQVIYVGTDTRYILSIGDDQTLTARQQNSLNGSAVYQVGDRVQAVWRNEHARALKAD